MAVTRIIPIRGSKGQSVIRSLTERTDYVKNPEKTEKGSLVYAYGCTPQLVAAEFALSKRQYALRTGRKAPGVIAYHIRQSFKPGEITPEEANLVGRELAERFLKGKHAYIVCTHVDRRHIHNHIIFNSTTIDNAAKFNNFFNTSRAVARLSYLICLERNLSIISNPSRGSNTNYGHWLGDKKQPSHRDVLRAAIDDALARKPNTFEELLQFVRENGYGVSENRGITFYKDGQKGIKLHTLGAGYSEAELRDVIAGKATHNPRGKRERASLLIDIEAKLAVGKGSGYAQWAKVFNVKQMAKTLLYLQEHGITGREELNTRADAASEKLSALNDRIKKIDTRIAEITELHGQIVTYAKTRKTFDEYTASRYSRKFFDAHADEIEQHRAAKRYFNAHGIEKLPKIKTLNAEFDTLVAEKRVAYAEYRAIRDEQRELLVHRHNVEMFLGKEKSSDARRDRGER
ncbi:MAG: relaxase/mobilization nuclease domain-containing protein [Oscillospiraceae bacterium]